MKFSWVSVIFFSWVSLLPGIAVSAPVAHPRIIDGEDAEEAPSWMAHMVIFRTGESGGAACGANLISSRWLLTAAHCVESYAAGGYEIQVTMGSVDRTSEDARVFEVDKVVSHPDYVPIGTSVPFADVALLRLSEAVNDLEPVKIMNSVDVAALSDNDDAIIYGWGLTDPDADSIPDRLQFANVSFLTRDGCNASEYWGGVVNEGSVCSHDPTKGVCSGDSGGPLIIVQGGEDFLVGITSYGAVDPETFQCAEGSPDVYMSPAYYFDWIAETVGLVGLNGDRSFGYIGVNESITETFSLVNYTNSSVGVAALSVSGTDSDKFTMSNNQCIKTLLPGDSCTFRITASSAVEAEADAHIVMERAEEGEDVTFGLSATFLPGIAADAPLQINGGSWFSNSDNSWSQKPSLGSGGTPGFTSGGDDRDSVLLLHVDGPFDLLVDGISIGEWLFDGVLIHLDQEPVNWYRLDDEETSMRVRIPEGAHRVLFTYEKTVSEGSEIGIYNFRTDELSSEGGGSDSGGSMPLWLLMATGVMYRMRSRVQSIR